MADGALSKQRQRAERILDAAAELVLRWGYKRVTIEEIAKRANIGKGTIYLHWKTREALFIAALARESAKLFNGLIAGIRKDPEEILMSRLVRRQLLLLKDHPLLQALFTRDTEVLGDLVGELSSQPLRGQKFAFSHEYLELLRFHGLLRNDLTKDAQFYAFNAAVFGFYVLDPLLPPEERLPLDLRAELVARIVRNAFESPEPPKPAVLRSLVPQVIAKFEQLRAIYSQFAQGNSP